MPDTGSSTNEATVHRGLEGVIVAETTISSVDGTAGRLAYRGYSIDDLAAHATFEEVLYLLWYGTLPTRAQLDDLRGKLATHRSLSPTVQNVLRALPTTGAPIDAQRAVVTAMGMEDPTALSLERDDVLEKSIRIAAVLPTALAAYVRLRRGQEPVEPAPDLDTAANFFYMLFGERQTELREHALDAYLVLLAEHSMNASTFSARVTISTISDLYSAISTALGTLNGDAHGRANQRAMEMLLEIGSADNVENYVEESLRTKRRLMGLGHRIYKVRDPRVNFLMNYSKQLADETGDHTWHDLAQRLEQVTAQHPFFLERKLYPNVEFYSAPLLHVLGFDTDMMPAAFAVSRIGGWSAHVLEQLEDNRLIRPAARYVGPEHLTYVPIDQRG